jgi:hypothetical protein
MARRNPLYEASTGAQKAKRMRPEGGHAGSTMHETSAYIVLRTQRLRYMQQAPRPDKLYMGIYLQYGT